MTYKHCHVKSYTKQPQFYLTTWTVIWLMINDSLRMGYQENLLGKIPEINGMTFYHCYVEIKRGEFTVEKRRLLEVNTGANGNSRTVINCSYSTEACICIKILTFLFMSAQETTHSSDYCLILRFCLTKYFCVAQLFVI